MITKKELKALLKAQQGELDAVEMYNALTGVLKDEKDVETFKALSADEGAHAAVVAHLSGVKLEPNKVKGKAIVLLYRVLGKERLYPIIAKKEYDAQKSYASLIDRFSELADIMDDEERHGDAVKALLNS